MTRRLVIALGGLMMLAGPVLQGLSGSEDPRAILFAPIMLAGLIPLLAGRSLQPSARVMAQAVLLCGALCLGAWYLGGLAGPVALPAALPLAVAVAGAAVAAGANLLLRPGG